MSSPAIGILGYGETKHVKRTERTLLSFFAEAALQAVSSAGLNKDQIDGLAVSSFFLSPDNAVTLSEQFGLSISWAWQFSAGSAGPVAGVMDAVRAVEAGQAEYVLCLAGDLYSVAAHYRLMRILTTRCTTTVHRMGSVGPTGCSASFNVSTWKPMG